MSKEIRIGKVSVPVSDEIYEEFYKMERRRRYLEEDVKVGSSIMDPETGEVIGYKPSKEDSIERLMDKGRDFSEEKFLEDIVVDKAMLLILQEAMKDLDHKDKELIDYLYYKKMTFREAAKKRDTSHVTVIKDRDKILNKLRKYF